MSIQFDATIDQLTPEGRAALEQVAYRMGVSTPAGVIGGQVVDAQGNPLPVSDYNRWAELVTGVMDQSIDPRLIMSSGKLSQPPGTRTNTGLSGAEQALEAGTTSALSTLGQGAQTARDDLTRANQWTESQLDQGKEETIRIGQITNDMANQTLDRGRNDVVSASSVARGQALQDINAGRSDVLGAGQYFNDQAQQALQRGRNDVLSTIAPALRAGQQYLSPYASDGRRANQQQAALSGALGSDAQQAAFEAFNASPGQQYLRDQQEKALLRNSAAIGGLGGGNVRTALQEQAAGIAAQDFNNYYARLGDVANRGAQAGQGLASLSGSLGGVAANQLGGLASQGAGVAGSLGGQAMGGLGSLAGQSAGIASSLGANAASQLGGLSNSGANITAGLGNNVMSQLGNNNQVFAQLNSQYGQNMANVAQNTGLNAANLLSGAGNNLANYRYDTGVNIANSLTNGNSQMATLNQNMGISQADLLGQYTTGLANLLSGTGTQMASGDQALAALIANIATGAGSQYAGLPGIPGTQAAPNNVVSDAGLITQALGGMIPNNNGASSGGGNQLYGYTELPNTANLA